MELPKANEAGSPTDLGKSRFRAPPLFPWTCSSFSHMWYQLQPLSLSCRAQAWGQSEVASQLLSPHCWEVRLINSWWWSFVTASHWAQNTPQCLYPVEHSCSVVVIRSCLLCTAACCFCHLNIWWEHICGPKCAVWMWCSVVFHCCTVCFWLGML